MTYMVLTKWRSWPTRGQVMAMTMVYQDLIRLSKRGDNKICCMTRSADFRFEHSLRLRNISLVGLAGQMYPGEFTRRLTLRAIYFH